MISILTFFNLIFTQKDDECGTNLCIRCWDCLVNCSVYSPKNLLKTEENHLTTVNLNKFILLSQIEKAHQS